MIGEKLKQFFTAKKEFRFVDWAADDIGIIFPVYRSGHEYTLCALLRTFLQFLSCSAPQIREILLLSRGKNSSVAILVCRLFLYEMYGERRRQIDVRLQYS